MRPSRPLPPAGYTRAAPTRPRPRRMAWAATAASGALGALLLSAGLMLPDDAPPPPFRPAAAAPVTPTTPLESAPVRPSAAPTLAPKSAAPRERRTARPVEARESRRAKPRRPVRSRNQKQGQKVAKHAKPVRPAAPSWAKGECRRRFPGDPVRQRACTAVLTGLAPR